MPITTTAITLKQITDVSDFLWVIFIVVATAVIVLVIVYVILTFREWVEDGLWTANRSDKGNKKKNPRAGIV